MKLKILSFILLLMLSISFSQSTQQGGIHPYPGQPTQEVTKTSPPLIPPWMSQGILIFIGIIIVLGMLMIFLIAMLFILKMLFGDKKISLAEQIKRRRIGDAKGFGGSSLNVVSLGGDKSIQPYVIGYCSGFKAEGQFDYITYHFGLPGYLSILKMIKGPRFQIYIPILDITIPDDHIIEIEPDLHTPPGNNIIMYATGLVPGQSGYDIPNTSKMKVSERMKLEEGVLISQVHGETASNVQKIAEVMWESSPKHFGKRDAESSRVSSGK